MFSQFDYNGAVPCTESLLYLPPPIPVSSTRLQNYFTGNYWKMTDAQLNILLFY